jgi:hypothetical protein
MPIRRVTQVAERDFEGKLALQHVFKPSVAASGVAGGWVDSSVSAGTPIYNAYVGSQLEATPFTGSGNRGIYMGFGDRRLVTALFQCRSAVVPAYAALLDYLMFYPLVDLDSSDLQEMDNTATLPRYTGGDGVRIMPVITVASATEVDCTVVYTNAAGVTGRSVTFRLQQRSNVGAIAAGNGVASSDNPPFVPLAQGCTGVRAIESVQLAAGAGGFASFVLVKPIAQVSIPELNTCSEVSYISDHFGLPTIYSGAYLNFIIKTQASAASSWIAQIATIED